MFPATIGHMRRPILVGMVFLVGIGGVFVYNGVADEQEFRRLITTGDRASTAGQTFIAVEAYSGALALNPDSMAVHLKRGETYQAHGNLQAARRDLLMAARLDPSATRPHERLGDVSMALKIYEDAVEHYDQFIRLDDQNPDVLYKLALAREHSGRVARAVPLLRRAIALNQSFVEAHYLLGLCLREQGRMVEARSSLKRAVELSPDFLQARESLVTIHRAEGNHREELQQLDALAALDGANPERHIVRALAYARAGRSEMAVLALNGTGEQHPDRPELSAALGQVWIEIAEIDEDNVALSKALEALLAVPLDSATSETLTLLARALRLSGDSDEARRILQLAISRYPIAPAAFLHLAQLEAKAHNREATRELRQRHRILTNPPGRALAPPTG